jgi:phosphopantothenoylcysteine decarboxylase / phosphopantothenate---cysteine ligase
VLLMAAAVSDFRPRDPQQAKIKKAGRETLALELESTEDVLGALASSRRADQTLVGFAAEHGGDPVAEARSKLERKRLDAVVVNDISRADIGFDAEDNEVTIVTTSDARAVPQGPKSAVAAAVLDEVERLRTESSAGATLGDGT